MVDVTCERAQIEVSVAHDESRHVDPEVRDHVATCPECRTFSAGLGPLDALLAKGSFDAAPDIASEVIAGLDTGRPRWWSVAAVALVGLVAGAVIGGVGTRLETSRAQDLDELFHATGTGLEGLSADLLVVERGVHEEVPERVYVGTIDYVAPEQLAISLVDTTEYPSRAWLANDLELTIADGDLVVTAGSRCPVAGMPACLTRPSTRAFTNLPPFDSGVLIPLEIVGPGRSLSWPSGLEVLGNQDHQGRPAIQVRTTVAAVDLIGALVDRGAWRDFHPTDTVVMWLDEATMVPLRIEIFAADSTERELWQLRRGYADVLGGEEPILIVELSDLVTEPPAIDPDTPADAVSTGFVDGVVAVPQPELPEGFAPHRSGSRPLGEGGVVDVATWSDGRSWLMVQVTADWDEGRLFGMSLPFVRPVDLGDDSIGYMAPPGDSLAIHGEDREVLVSGSVPPERLVEVAATLGIRGLNVPGDWLEASTVEISELPPATLVPDVDGWSTTARVEEGEVSILMTSGGSRSILISQRDGDRLEPPVGPDVYEVDMRGAEGRYDAATGTLEWLEDGRIIVMRSDTVGRDAMQEVAESLNPG